MPQFFKAAFTTLRALALGVILLPTLAQAQEFRITAEPAKAAPGAANLDYMAPSRIKVNMATAQTPRPYFSDLRIELACTGTYDYCHALVGDNVPNRYNSGGAPTGYGSHNGGSFRTGCQLAFIREDDYIVRPGQPGTSHAHGFAGTIFPERYDLIGTPTTCAGGIMNSSAYWFPLGVIHCLPSVGAGACPTGINKVTRKPWADGDVVVPSSSNWYYKVAEINFSSEKGSHANLPFASRTPVEWWPIHFQMIAGDPNATAPQYIKFPDGSSTGILLSKFNCQSTSGGQFYMDHIPVDDAEAVLCNSDFTMIVSFPECSDGVNVDGLAPQHNSHVQYMTDANNGCTDPAFPIMHPAINLNLHYDVPYTVLKSLRLSSDPPKSSGRPAGYTLHADWKNGWDQVNIIPQFGMVATDALIRECYMVGWTPAPMHSDCHDFKLGSPARDGKWWNQKGGYP